MSGASVGDGFSALPNAVEAEKELVSVLFLDSSVFGISEVSNLSQKDFYNSLCREMFFAGKREWLEGREVVFSALLGRLPSGPDWLRFFDDVSTLAVHSDAGLVRRLCGAIREARIRREIYFSLGAALESTRGGGEVGEVLSLLAARLTDIGSLSLERRAWEQTTKSEILSGPQLVSFLDQRVEYLVDPILPKGFVVLLQGQPKGGKSTFSLFVSICLALGRCIGPFRVDRACRVLFLEFEDPPILFAKRASIYSRGLGLALGELPQGLEYCYYPEFWIDSPAHYAALCDVISERKIDLVVIDTLSHVNRADDENSSASMRPAMMRVKQLAKETNSSVLIVHHTAKGSKDRSVAEKGRGSSVIAAAADVIIDWGDRNGGDTTPVRVESKLDASSTFDVEYRRMPDGSVEWIVRTGQEMAQDRRSQKERVLAFIEQDFALNPKGRPLGEILTALPDISEQMVYRYIRSLENDGKVSISISNGRGNPRTVRLITKQK